MQAMTCRDALMPREAGCAGAADVQGRTNVAGGRMPGATELDVAAVMPREVRMPGCGDVQGRTNASGESRMPGAATCRRLQA